MNIKKYFWELNPKALKETEKIVKNPEHPKFIERIFTLLSRCDNPGDLFSLISKEQFVEVWPKVRRYWMRTKQAEEFRSWWESVYEQLLEKKKIKKRIKGKPPEIFVKIGEIIKNERLKRQLSQADFARKAGMKQPDVSAIEAGKKNITLETLIRLCKILDIKNISLNFKKYS